ncbi:hypothetical protein GCM10009544_16960 [Streptomyces stramineus]|uniref:Uncharacterized protein n=1 Tax=Streptomyces stramineus TaxID=173861 RepID=A0ABP3JIH5_9ACTN
MPAVEAAPVVPVIPVVVPAPRPVAVPVPAVDDVDQEQELVLEGLTRDQVRDWRVRAMKDPQLVFDRIDRYGAHGRVRRSAGRARGRGQLLTPRLRGRVRARWRADWPFRTAGGALGCLRRCERRGAHFAPGSGAMPLLTESRHRYM